MGSPMPRDQYPDVLNALNWLLEAGADEAVLDAPVNRFAPNASPAQPRSGNGTLPFPGDNVRSDQRHTLKETPRAPIQRPAFEKPSAPMSLEGDNIGHAIEIAARCNSLPELKAALESFEGSQLKKNALNTVFADGNPDSRILFIGEAPGRDEDRMGLPFVGRAGKLLDLMMAAIGLDRSSAYIINVLPWRPPDNRNPEPTEVAQCIPFLRRHIELAAPEILVLLGAVSVRHVLG